MEKKLLVTARQLGPILGISERTVREWGMSGVEGFPGPVIDRPTKKLWSLKDIEEWIERRRAR